MDARFRVRFWPRRAKTAPSELDLHSVPYQTATEGQREPVFIHQPLGRNLSERRKQSDALALRGFAYLRTRPGKPPIFGDRPHKGNGPIKLNATRRLSSGDLQTTTEDQARIFEDIRDGEYVVAGKDKRDSQTMSVTSPVPGDRRQSNASAHGHSPIQRHPPTSTPASWAPFQGSSPLLDIPEHGMGNSASSQSTLPPPPWTSNSPDVFARPGSVQSSQPTDGLGIVEFAQPPHGILKKVSSSASLIEPSSEQNATIRALWKAEYKQLVAIYGENGVTRNIGDGPWEQKRLSTIQDVHHREEKPMPFTLEPLPRPSFEHRDGNSQKTTSRHSRNEQIQQEDTSDESSQQRLSFISSAGYASSYTTRASVADSDSINTQQDIRTIVANMRSTYIQAIESREPSMQALKTMKKKKKKRSSTTPQSTPRASSNPSTPELDRAGSGRANDSSSSLRSQRSTRVVSQPVATISTLPAIEASPTRAKDVDVGLQRADSSTLGALMGETKRASIRKRKSERISRRQSSPSRHRRESSRSENSTFSDKENSQSPKQQESLDDEMVSLFRDIFINSSDDFWKSSPALTTTLAVPSSLEQPSPYEVTPTATAVHTP